jgi:NADH:ubiquinone oxidoreductase subunit 5 (subunit L)/multisubunit Na+/H+ antiporter MnhA subunit
MIHAMSEEDEQYMHKMMGGLASLLPFIYVMMFIGSLFLIGFPSCAIFYSKNFILEFVYT